MPAYAATAALPKLAGDTLLTGSRPVKMAVEVPAHAVLDVGWDTDFSARLHGVTVSGKGRFVGVVLSGRNSRGLPITVWAFKLGFCDAPGCSSGNPNGLFGATTNGESKVELVAGRYDLYLLTDGAPVTVRLTLQGLRGHTTLRPTTPYPLQEWAPAPHRTTLGPSGFETVSYVGSTTTTLTGPGAVLTGDWMQGQPVGHHLAEHCLSHSTPGQAAPLVDTGCGNSVAGLQNRFSSQGYGPGWWAFALRDNEGAGGYDLSEDATYQGHVEDYQSVNVALTW